MCLQPVFITHPTACMKKILITHSYFLRFDSKQWKAGLPYPPLGTLIAAACLRELGHAVHFLDTQFAESTVSVEKAIDQLHPDLVVIYDDSFNYLTKMCLTNMREAAWEICAMGQKRNIPVWVNSSDATDHYSDYLEAGAEMVLLGEGEQTLQELVQTTPAEQSHVPGIACKQADGTIVKTIPRPVLTQLDELPMPAWDMLDITPYRNSWLQHAGYFSINIATTRGCPFKCNWCAKPIYGNRYHSRSPEKVVEEIVWLKEYTGMDHIWFCDDIFGLKPGWVLRFSALMKERGLKIPFKIQSRADLLVQENYVTALAEAGCTNVWMGAESGSQQILDAMDKGIRTEQIREATQLLKQHSIAPSLFIQFGYPGETWQDIQLTQQMIRNLTPESIGISVSYPLPGTVFYERVKKDLAAKSNWSDSDDLHLMFRHGFQPAFYRKLHRYTHSRFLIAKARQELLKQISKPGGSLLRIPRLTAVAIYHAILSNWWLLGMQILMQKNQSS
jgi:anaerobic magnesium-protoporphyrin IX monomethyl ester cyclase